MTEDEIDKMSIRLFKRSARTAQWIILQYAILFLMPFTWNTVMSGPFFALIALYTLLYNLYWYSIAKKKRLKYLLLPYLVYLIIFYLTRHFWKEANISDSVIILLPFYGALCFIVARVFEIWLEGIPDAKLQHRLRIAFVISYLILFKVVSVNWGCKDQGDLNTEKTEILQRLDYLTDKLVTSPNAVLSAMPSVIGSQFQGEWALYSCSMLTVSLANIISLYPEAKTENLEYIDKLIQIVNTPELRAYDSKRWKGDAIRTLDSDVSHISYISHLAWMICNYKMSGGDSRYDNLCSELCEAMNRRISKSSAFNLPTYPNEAIYIPDMLVAIVALKKYSKLSNGKYSTTVSTWLRKVKELWIDKETGLLVSFLDENGSQIQDAPVKGSYSSLNCYYLSLVDKSFAREQYELLKKHFWKGGIVDGMKEYSNKTPLFTFDIDAGPVVMGLRPSGTAFATGPATFFEDAETRKDILQTGEIAGHTVFWNGKRHYALANIAIVGESIMLAMRTNNKN